MIRQDASAGLRRNQARTPRRSLPEDGLQALHRSVSKQTPDKGFVAEVFAAVRATPDGKPLFGDILLSTGLE